MWESAGFTNEDWLWAGAGLYGGIGGHQKATCGAVADGAVFLGLRHRVGWRDKEAVTKAKAQIEKEASEMAKEFIQQFETTVCIDLVKIDLSVPENWKIYLEQNISARTCDLYLQFVIEKLYEFEERSRPPG
jgi:hypothetical protein